jgi:hypothetical protein
MDADNFGNAESSEFKRGPAEGVPSSERSTHEYTQTKFSLGASMEISLQRDSATAFARDELFSLGAA